MHCYNVIGVSATCMDIQADVMLVKNAQNLMQAVIKTTKAAEAACMKVTLYHYTFSDSIVEHF